MAETPAPSNSGPPDDPPGFLLDRPMSGDCGWRRVPQSADWPEWMTDEALLAARAEPWGLEDDEDPDHAPPSGMDDAPRAALIAEAREFSSDQAAAEAQVAAVGRAGLRAALGSVAAGRRGPGMPGSASTFPGEYLSRASAFASGMVLDTAPGHPVLGQLAAEAAGDGDRYAGASDDELVGVICGWERVESHASARKHAAVAELIRRRPAPGHSSGLPAQWDEFTCRELGAALALPAGDAEEMLDIAAALETRLPGTRAAFRAGVLTRDKARIIVAATVLLDPAQARAAEDLVLGRAGTLTPAGLRSAIARAVMQISPGQARRRRERAARMARVQRWAEPSGNAGITGRELPRPRCWPLTSGSPGGPGSCAKQAWTVAWICCGPGRSWTSCSASTPAPSQAPARPRATSPAATTLAGPTTPARMTVLVRASRGSRLRRARWRG
jgi:hypothetical protein